MPMKNRKKLGNALIQEKLINREQLTIALKEQAITKGRLGDIITRFGFCKRDDIIKTMKTYCPDELIGQNLTNIEFPKSFLLSTQSMGNGNDGHIVYISTLNKNPEMVRQQAEKIVNDRYANGGTYTVKLAPCNVTAIRKFLAENKMKLNEIKDNNIAEEQKDVNILLKMLIDEAMEKRTSDIHIIHTEETILIKFRIDGVLHVSHILSKENANTLYPRIKGKTSMDITQTRTQQDGSFSEIYKGRVIDFRVACKPCKDGEKITIRILDKQNVKRLDEIGISVYEELKEMTQRVNGLFLICGPTGSGKTTSLYSLIQNMDYIQKNICTIEDPIEYTLPFIDQTQVNRLVDLDFKDFTRGVLRHDPDVILVGELRDLETVENCIQLCETGHFVLSSLHSNDVIATFSRLENIGVNMSLLSHNLRGIMVQTLARRICTKCNAANDRTPRTLTTEVKCKVCNDIGYFGRTPVVEFVSFDNEHDFNQVRNGEKPYHTFQDDARLKVQQGITDCKEISRVLNKEVKYCNGDECIKGGAKCM